MTTPTNYTNSVNGNNGTLYEKSCGGKKLNNPTKPTAATTTDAKNVTKVKTCWDNIHYIYVAQYGFIGANLLIVIS